jgi:hypothetical protein
VCCIYQCVLSTPQRNAGTSGVQKSRVDIAKVSIYYTDMKRQRKKVDIATERADEPEDNGEAMAMEAEE